VFIQAKMGKKSHTKQVPKRPYARVCRLAKYPKVAAVDYLSLILRIIPVATPKVDPNKNNLKV